MNIIEKIKEWFQRRKTKALPEATEYYELNDERKRFVQEMQVTEEQQVEEEVKNKYLENSLQLFFESYQELLNTNTGYADAYNALVRINALGGDNNINAIQEQQLLEYLQSSGKYTIQNQVNKYDGLVDFYHIKTNGYELPSDDKMIRIYLNCRNENTAELAKQLAYCNNVPNFYLKVDSTNALNRADRSEKIVIYTTEEQFDYCVSLINHIKTYRPDLFQDSEKTNPFMESSDVMSYARQPISSTFYNLDGSTYQISQSANRYISTIIKESYMAAVREIISVEPELQFLLQPEYYNDEMWYMKNYAAIDSRYHAFLVNSMEAKMRNLCMYNGVVIKGINDSRQLQEEQEVDR